MVEAYYLFSLVFGLIVGSFLNVVIYRFNTGKTLGGRSKCLACNAALTWRELVPLASYFIQKGKCKSCGAKISVQYAVVEALTAIIFLLFAIHGYEEIGPDWLTLGLFLISHWAIASVLTVIAVYDLRHKIIPDRLVYLFMALGALAVFITDLNFGLSQMIWLLHGIYSGGIFFGLFWLLWHFSKGRLMGFGDAKFVFGLGLWLGLYAGFWALVTAFFSGAAVGLLLVSADKSKYLPAALRSFTIKSEIPFAPFLVFGALVGFIFFFHV